MHSILKRVRAFGPPLGKHFLRSLPAVSVLAIIIASYLMIGFSYGSSGGGASYGKDKAVSMAMEHISNNYTGLSSVELARASRDEGEWRLAFKCVRGSAASGKSTGQRITIRLFVDEDSRYVRGLSTDGW